MRVQHEDDSTKHVVMTQGERAVGFHLDPEGGILSCQVFKRNELILKMLNLEVRQSLEIWVIETRLEPRLS